MSVDLASMLSDFLSQYNNVERLYQNIVAHQTPNVKEHYVALNWISQ